MSGPLRAAARHCWIDASAGIAGDMLLGALLDAGADLDAVRAAVDTVVPESVRLSTAEVDRAGQRATKLSVEVITDDVPARQWSTIRTALAQADLDERVRERAHATFALLARAEAAAHGIAEDEVHFHEVGALDSIADVVGVAAALTDLGVQTVSAGVVAVGSGRTRAAHGDLPVPVPAVVRLSAGWQIRAGGVGELTTPTGMALVAALAGACEELPAMILDVSGAGAGTKDVPDRPNITRVLIGERPDLAPTETATPDTSEAVVLEANVDDLDPRVWPGVLDRLLRHGASDAWLVPIVMKKGRPAHTLAVLCPPEHADALQRVIISETSTLGVRRTPVTKLALRRGWVQLELPIGRVGIKISYDGSGIRQVNPEFADVAALAAASGSPEREVLDAARASARAAGLVVGSPVPASLDRVPMG